MYSIPHVNGLHPAGKFRLRSLVTLHSPNCTLKQVVVLKDQVNKKAHAESARLACEAAGSIRTVASLTREADCLALYSQSLEKPLTRSNRTALWANLLFAFSQSLVFGVIALVFWYGAVLVSRLEASTFDFFVALMVYYFYLFSPCNFCSSFFFSEYGVRCYASRQCVLLRS